MTGRQRGGASTSAAVPEEIIDGTGTQAMVLWHGDRVRLGPVSTPFVPEAPDWPPIPQWGQAGVKSCAVIPQDIVAAKVVNALVQDVSSPLEGAFGTGRAIRGARERYGGLWVGGRVTLTRAELRFAPNAANRLVHRGDPSFTIPLAAVRQVDVEPGVLTKIIAVTWTGGVTRFRCYGAGAFARQIRATAG